MNMLNANEPATFKLEVPSWLYPDALAFVAQRMQAAARENAKSTTVDDIVDVPGNGTWTRSDFHRLHEMLRNPTGRAVFTAIAIASLDDRAITYEDLTVAGAAASGGVFEPNNLRSQLAWIGKYCKTIKGAGVWPIPPIDHGKDKAAGQRYTYQMPKKIAQWWLDIIEP
jgi:hypothetical protein